MKKTPIFFMGNKEKLIRKGLIELFPHNIDTFYDLFCGSGVVSLNVDANNKILNDTDKIIIDLINYFKENKKENIINNIDNLIKKYELPTFSTDARRYKGDRNIFKEKYNVLRNDYNNTKDIELLYILNIFSNSHMIRFNSQGDFNMPFGNGYFTDTCRHSILQNEYYELTKITNVDFREYFTCDFKENDFVYLDPPYLNTTATYNENGAWIMKDDIDLMKFCDMLNSNNIKFALSNVMINKGIENKHLISWSDTNSYKIHFFDNFTYCACGKGNANTVEILITNY